MIKKILALVMRSFVKLYFKLDNECIRNMGNF